MARRASSTPPPIEIRRLTEAEIDRGIQQLRRRMAELQQLDANVAAAPENDSDKIVASNIGTTILEIFGEHSPEYRDHRLFNIWGGPMAMGMHHADVVEGIEAGKRNAAAL